MQLNEQHFSLFIKSIFLHFFHYWWQEKQKLDWNSGVVFKGGITQ